MIHVCYGLYDKDGRYSKWTGTSMLSMFENISAPPPSVIVHILHDNTLSLENRDKFNQIAGRYGQIVKFWNVEELCRGQIEDFKRMMPSTVLAQYSIASIYRFLIPSLLSDVDKIIYLDSDTIVNLDIKELWQIELHDKPLGGAPEAVIDMYHNQMIPIHYLMQAGFVGVEDYFNSGVLLLNLAELRRRYSDLTNGIKFVAEHPECRWFDQDVLNYCFAKDYVKLPEKFDVMVLSERAAGKSATVRKAIYHYIGTTLGANAQENLNKLWIKYFAKTAWFNEETIGHLCEGTRQIYNAQKRFALKISEIMSGRTRAFFTSPQDIENVKKIFGITDAEEIIPASSPESLKIMIRSLEKSGGKKIFFILSNNPEVYHALLRAGFTYGKDFINAIEFLSEAEGVPFNSHLLIKVL